VIGVAPSIAKEEVLKRYEYFGQYGKILQITIKDDPFQSENQGTCYSVYVTYSNSKEASLAMLAIDSFVYEGRLMRASYGRTKYCKFFLKDT
jgi:CCR4-NOT transcription complex subunit 4